MGELFSGNLQNKGYVQTSALIIKEKNNDDLISNNLS